MVSDHDASLCIMMMINNHPQALAQLAVHRGGFVHRNKIETPISALFGIITEKEIQVMTN